MTYLGKFKMYNFSSCTAEHSICAIFCRVSHGVKFSITTPNDLSLSLKLIHSGGFVSFPVSQNSQKQELALVYKVCSSLYIWIPRSLSTLQPEAPAMRMAKLGNIYPAGYLPSTRGCDLHTKALKAQLSQHCVTVTIVLFFCAQTVGLCPLHLTQISENGARSLVQNSINLGSSSQGMSVDTTE